MFLAILFLISLLACNKEEATGGKETRIHFEALEFDSRAPLSTGFTAFRVIVLRDDIVTRYFHFAPGSFTGNDLTVHLPVGSYKILFIANGSDEEVTCNTGDPLEKVLLNLCKEGDDYREAPDFLTAIKRVNIAVGQANEPLPVSLRRGVGKIRVTLNGLPADIDSLKIELANVPRYSSVDGEVTGPTVNILKRVKHVKGNNSITTDIMTFPVAANKAEVNILYSIGHLTYRGFMKLAPAIDSNRVVVVTGNYLPTLAQRFEFDARAWDEANPVDGGSMDLDLHDELWEDNTPAAGRPVGENLLANGSFETWVNDSTPAAWKFSSNGANKSARVNTRPACIAAGGASCLLGERTYLYQDVTVTARKCYQVRVKVNSNTSAYKWRVLCTWLETASSRLPSTAMQGATTGTTGGWVDTFEKENKFRAPVGATILRVEARAYTAGNNVPAAGEGVYIDDCDVRLLEE